MLLALPGLAHQLKISSLTCLEFSPPDLFSSPGTSLPLLAYFARIESPARFTLSWN
jgi:hypothetical protein